MPNPIVVAELRATIGEFQAKMGEARAEMESTQKKGESSFGGMQQFGTQALLGLAAGAVAVGVAAVHLADTFEVSHARLVTALDNSGHGFDEWKGSIASAEKQGEKFGITNAEIEDALSRLVTAVHDPAVALNDLKVAEDLAAARGLDLNTASQLVGKAAEGTYTALVKLGVVTKEQAASFKTGAEAVGFMAEAFKGQAAAQADTFAGKMNALKATVEDTGKNLGLWLIPKLEAVATVLDDGVKFLAEHKQAVEILGGVIGAILVPALLTWAAAQAAALASSVATAISGYIGLISSLAAEMTTLGLATELATGPLGMLAAAVVGLTIKGNEWSDVTDKEKGYISDLVNAMGPAVDKVAALTVVQSNLGAEIDRLKHMPDWEKYTGQVADLSNKFAAVTFAIKDAHKAQTDHTQAQKDAAQASAGLGTETATETQKLKDQKQAVDELKRSVDDMVNQQLALSGSTIALFGDLDKLTAGFKANGTTLDVTTEKGRLNMTQIDSTVGAIIKNRDALIAQNASVDIVNRSLDAHVIQLIRVMRAGGETDAQIQALVNQYHLVPPDILTQLIANAAANVTVNIPKVTLEGKTPVSGAFATGGMITEGPALVGEGNRNWAEFVVPTDPAHRQNAMALFGELGRRLGISGLAAGGIVANEPLSVASTSMGAQIAAQMAPGLAQGMANALKAATSQAVQQTGLAAFFGGASAPGNVSGNAALAQMMAAARGWNGAEWAALYQVGQMESGWNALARNAASGAYGIAQALPESKYPFAGTQAGGSDPGVQIGWMLDYIAGRYGDPLSALGHERAYNWYDQGGWLQPGLNLAMNGTGVPERVLPPGGDPGSSGGDLILQIDGQTVARILAPHLQAALLRRGRQTVDLRLG